MEKLYFVQPTLKLNILYRGHQEILNQHQVVREDAHLLYELFDRRREEIFSLAPISRISGFGPAQFAIIAVDADNALGSYDETKNITYLTKFP